MSNEEQRDAQDIEALNELVKRKSREHNPRLAEAQAAPPPDLEPEELDEDEVPVLSAENAPFPVSAPAMRRAAETEDLLNGLIAECHYLMREVALPSATGTRYADNRNSYLRQAMNLATTGAEVAGAVAKLRIADRVSPEAQGRIIDAVAQSIVK